MRRRILLVGATGAFGTRLARMLGALPKAEMLVLTSEDGVQAAFASEDEIPFQGPVRVLEGGTQAWRRAGYPLSRSAERLADEPVDVWLKPYERASDHEAAMNAYLSWEVDLLDRIRQDGTTHFLRAG